MSIKSREYIGKPVVFMGYDGKMYDGTLVNVLKRGIEISYYVPQVMRECRTCLTTDEAKKRVVVQI